MGGPRHDRRLPLIVSNLRDIVLAGFRHRGAPVRAGLGFTLGLWPSFSSLFTGLRGRGILRSSDARSCIDPPLRGARMASKAFHAAWRRSTYCGVGWICRETNAPVMAIMLIRNPTSPS